MRETGGPSPEERGEQPEIGELNIERSTQGGNRWVNLVDGEGHKLEGAVADELKLVKSQEQVGPEKIDPEGGKTPGEMGDEPVAEAPDNRAIFESKLKILFREFPGQVYRAGKVNERAMGDRVDFTQGPNDFVYVIPQSGAETMKAEFDKAVSNMAGEVGLQFAQRQIDDQLGQNKLGFTRTLMLDNEKFTVKFVYGQEKE